MTAKKHAPEALAERLLEAHIQHEVAAFDEAQFMRWVDEELAELHQWLQTVKLKKLVTPAAVKKVVKLNVVERDIPGAIPEIAGEAASLLFEADFNQAATLEDILTRRQFEAWVDKTLELHEQRKKGLNRLIDLPIYTDLISDVIYQAITRYIYDTNILSKNVPGVSSMLKLGKKWVDKAVPKLEGALEENIKSYINDNLSFLLRESKSFLENTLTDEQIKDAAMELWDGLSSQSLGDLQAGMSSWDLSEFIVLGYEFWRHFRKTDYFRQCYEWVIDYFFEKYGEASVGLLLEDFNITPEMASQQVALFAPRALKTLKKSGHLEAILRRRLARFYQSEAALACLRDG